MDSSSDMFVERARERVVSIGKDIAQLEAQEQGVRRKVRELQEQLENWETALQLYAEAMKIKLPEPVPGQMAGFLDASEAAVPDLVAHYMAERGRRARIRDLTKWLVSIGRFSDEVERSGQLYGQVYTAVLRHPERFEKEGPGTFRLLVTS